MPKQYTRAEYWKLYEKLPEELQEAIFSAETADHISNICARNSVSDKQIPQVAARVGDVLMGLLLPDELQEELEKEVKLKKPAAQSVTREMNRFVFFPVKPQLEELHQTPGSTDKEKVSLPIPRHSDRLQKQVEQESPEEEALPFDLAEEEEPENEKSPDPYREPF